MTIVRIVISARPSNYVPKRSRAVVSVASIELPSRNHTELNVAQTIGRM